MLPPPAKIDRFGPAYKASDIGRMIVSEINSETSTYFIRRAKKMTNDFDAAAKLMEETEQRFSKNMQSMLLRESALSDATKKVGGQVRKAANDLADGLAKVEKSANFDRLERYVALLERAASAMETLADLENSGKLDRIAAALK